MFAPQQRGMRLVPLFIERRPHVSHLHSRIICTTYSCNPLASNIGNTSLTLFFTVRLSRNARFAFTTFVVLRIPQRHNVRVSLVGASQTPVSDNPLPLTISLYFPVQLHSSLTFSALLI